MIAVALHCSASVSIGETAASFVFYPISNPSPEVCSKKWEAERGVEGERGQEMQGRKASAQLHPPASVPASTESSGEKQQPRSTGRSWLPSYCFKQQND